MKLEEVKDAVFTCMGCGDCGYSIRSAVGKFKVCPVKEAHDTPWEVFFSRGRMQLAKGVLDGALPLSKELAEIVYQCTSCGGCHDTCHQSHSPHVEHFVTRWVDHVKIWETFRADLVDAGFILDRHKEFLTALQNPEMLNPYGKSAAEKKELIGQLQGFAEKGETDVGFFSGCTYPFQFFSSLENLGRLFTALDLKVVKIPDEVCCGSVAYRIGDIDTGDKLKAKNAEILEEYGIKTLIAACSGCYRTLKMDHEIGKKEDEENDELGVLHITEYLEAKLKDKAVLAKFTNQEPITVVYHDPCHLGRHAEVYEAPRNILQALPGVTLVEMKRHGHNAWCCGAGGGVKGQFPDLALKIGQERVAEALQTGASLIVTSCPFCVRNLQDAAESKQTIEVIDILDFLIQRLD